ncbi:MAG: hypothetical protein ABFD96_25165 [Armatimonadia bacterium]
MPTFADWFARSPLASALRVFAAVVLTLAVTQWVTNGSIDFAAWQTWVIAALASVAPTLARWINPADVEFGRGAIEFTPFDVWGDDDA